MCGCLFTSPSLTLIMTPTQRVNQSIWLDKWQDRRSTENKKTNCVIVFPSAADFLQIFPLKALIHWLLVSSQPSSSIHKHHNGILSCSSWQYGMSPPGYSKAFVVLICLASAAKDIKYKVKFVIVMHKL